jgi:hypothetical protein
LLQKAAYEQIYEANGVSASKVLFPAFLTGILQERGNRNPAESSRTGGFEGGFINDLR